MINIKKGSAHSLGQSDWLGTVQVDAITRVVTPTIVAGQIVSRHGDSAAVVSGLGALTDQVGFAVTDSSEGDAKESKKIGAYALDGSSTVETDQVVETINTTNFPYGAPVYAYTGTNTAGYVGKVSKDELHDTSVHNLKIGTVDAIRTVYVGQTPHTLLGIKLTA